MRAPPTSGIFLDTPVSLQFFGCPAFSSRAESAGVGRIFQTQLSSSMATPFLGEVKIISWNFPPKGWAFCNGQFLPINQNQALFSLLGTTYGGNGTTTFALPNLQGRTAVHFGAGIV